MTKQSHVNTTQWYVVNTKPNCEDLVDHGLSRAFVESFLPKIDTKRRSKKPAELLFPGYLFARLNPARPDWVKIRYTPGVRRVLGYGDIPVPVPEKVISAIRDRIARNGYAGSSLSFKKGDRVRFIRGPFEGLEGIFTGKTSGKERAEILLTTIHLHCAVQSQCSELTRTS